MRKISYFLGLWVGLAFMVLWQAPTLKTKIIACDVGQGDAILIVKGRPQVLIDGGPSSEKILACLERPLPFWDHTIELIVMTNTDFDHMNGLSAVIDRYGLGDFVTADGIRGSSALAKFQSVLSRRGVRVLGVEQGETIKVGESGELKFEVLWPPEVKYEYLAVFSDEIESTVREQILGASAKQGDVNERSVVLMLTLDNYRALFTGDSGFQAEKGMLEQGLVSNIDYLKVGHHGSKYSTNGEFLDKLLPSVAVISVGAKNRYGHPTGEVLARLRGIGAQILRTDESGDVVVEIPAEN